MKECIFLFIFIAHITAVYAQNTTQTVTQNFDCGNNCQATLYSDGTFEVKPINPNQQASMTNYSVLREGNKWYSTAPWLTSDYIEDIQKVVISENVQNISFAGFYFAENVTEVILPEGLTQITPHAFGGSGISNIILPNTLTEIGTCSFDYSALESIIIPDSVTTIGREAFYSCKSLKSVVIGDGITSVGNNAFGNIASDAKIYCQNTSARQCDTLLTDTTGGKNQLVLYTKQDGYYIVGNQRYRTLENMQKDISAKRIYTVDEAVKISGNKNSVSLRYK